jgi:hypothetical protein
MMLLTACSTAEPALPEVPVTPAGTFEPTTGATPTIAVLIPEVLATPEVELMRLSGSGPAVSPVVNLAEDTLIQLNWKNSGTEKFIITIFNKDPNEVDPSYKEPALELPYYASEGIVEYFLVAGNYEIRVDSLAGNWEIWLDTAVVP